LKICGRWNDKIIGRIWEMLTEEFIDLCKSISSVKVVEWMRLQLCGILVWMVRVYVN